MYSHLSCTLLFLVALDLICILIFPVYFWSSPPTFNSSCDISHFSIFTKLFVFPTFTFHFFASNFPFYKCNNPLNSIVILLHVLHLCDSCIFNFHIYFNTILLDCYFQVVNYEKVYSYVIVHIFIMFFLLFHGLNFFLYHVIYLQPERYPVVSIIVHYLCLQGIFLCYLDICLVSFKKMFITDI